MEKYTYRAQGVCSYEMVIEYEEEIIKDIHIFGGCAGNHAGIVALIKGMKLSEARDKLKGIKCGFRSTSCPDQLARAFDNILTK